MKGNTKKYLIYDGDVLIGEMTGAEAGERFGISKNRCAQYALVGTRLKGKYTVKYADPDQELRRPDAKYVREGFWEEWKEAAEAVRKGLMAKAEKPVREKRWLWKA